nr:PD40 domain-containing protein [Candidatus Ozemobacteraceae bacterium]
MASSSPVSRAFSLLAGIGLTVVCMVVSAGAQQMWKLPAPRIMTIVDSPPTPTARVSPRGGKMLLIQHRNHVPLSELARPILRLAGIRFFQESNMRQRTSYMTGGSVLDLETQQAVELQFPPDGKAGYPSWSPDGSSIVAIMYTPGGAELWKFDPSSGKGHCILQGLNDLLTTPYQWEYRHGAASGSFYIFASIVPPDRGDPPQAPPVPPGPTAEEASGMLVKARTFQDLLKTSFHDSQFAHFATSQFVRVDLETASATPVGTPDLFRQGDISPDGRYLLTDRLTRPFSHAVPADLAGHVYEIRDASSGALLRVVANLAAGEQIPINGVATGPRSVQWTPLMPATLFWAEALDGGDPLATAAFRDRLFTLAPFDAGPAPVTDLPQRFGGADWL